MDMILTGRPVRAEEAKAWGLVDRLVPDGQALVEAERLAADIARFPQVCLRTDRASALAQWSLPAEEALLREALAGQRPLEEEAARGAASFLGGAGRGGSFSKA
jgi:enoyl-CoA hydratase